MQLDQELQNIIRLYGSYVSCIRESLKAKGVQVGDLCSDLLTISAFNHTQQKRMLLHSHKAELEGATDLNRFFNILITEYASFLNYEIFQVILDKYHLNKGQEEFKYPDHLDAYLRKHKVSEFVQINPLLKKVAATSKELVLKIDIVSTSELAKLKKLKTGVAQILGLKPAAIQLLDIKEGCVVVTFLIPTGVAEIIFTKQMIITKEQEREFKALSILRLECNGLAFDFSVKDNPAEELLVTTPFK